MANLQSLLQSIHTAVMTQQWWIAASGILILVSHGVRWLAAKKLGKLGAWLNTDHGAMWTVIVTGLLGGLATAFGAGRRPTMAEVGVSLKVAGLSIVTYPSVKKFILSQYPNAAQVLLDMIKPAPAAEPAPLPPPPPAGNQKGRLSTTGIVAIAVLALLGMVAAAAMAGCAFCTVPANASQAKCVAETVSVDCGLPAAEKAIVALEPALLARVNGSAIDWPTIGVMEKNDGIGAVACAFQELDGATVTAATPNARPSHLTPELRAAVVKDRDAVHLHYNDYVAARRVKFKGAAVSMLDTINNMLLADAQ